MSQLALSALFEYLCYAATAIINILLFQCGDRLYTSDSDVYRLQNLTSKVCRRTDRVNIIYLRRKTVPKEYPPLKYLLMLIFTKFSTLIIFASTC